MCALLYEQVEGALAQQILHIHARCLVVSGRAYEMSVTAGASEKGYTGTEPTESDMYATGRGGISILPSPGGARIPRVI